MSDEGPAGGGRGDFGGVDGDDGVENASTEAIEEACAYHPSSALGGGLECGAYDCPEGTEGYAFYAAVVITDGAAYEAADEGAEVVC